LAFTTGRVFGAIAAAAPPTASVMLQLWRMLLL
jgi:hypothetical protein